MLRLGFLAGLAAASWSAGVEAQSAPSPFTYGTRYDASRQVTGTISADPDWTLNGAPNGGLPYQAVRNTYDPAGRLAKVEKGSLPVWQDESIAPANWANFSIYTVSVITYDAMGRKTSEAVTPGGASPSTGVTQTFTQYSYNNQGLLECTAVRINPAAFNSLATGACALTSPGSFGQDRITHNVYDAAGQLLKIQKAYGTSLQQDYATYEYTPNGKQKAVIDANGNRAELTYDGFDRQAAWYFPSPTSTGTASTTDYEAYGYDANGNRTSLRKRDGRTITYGYDALNRLTAKYIPDGCAPIQVGGCPPASATRDVHYAYDLRGLQMQARFDTAVGAERVESGFDGFGQVFATTIHMGGASRTLSYLYDAGGNRVRITHPDGVNFTTDHDGLDRLTGAQWWAPGVGTVPFLGISYNAAGLRSGTGRASSVTGYGYDGVSRLASLGQGFAGGAGNVTTGFGYNPASQLVQRTSDNDDYSFTGYVNVSRGYQTNGLNQYTAAGSATFSYDANGNLIGDGTTSYVYDAENRLISASNGATLAYDPQGRLWRTSGSPSGASDFLYDGAALVAEYDAANGAMRRRYMHASGDDEPILWDEGSGMNCSGTKFLHHNHQGSIVALANCWGNRVAVNTYDEYGITRNSVDALVSPQGRFGYTGQAWIPELGMYHYKARIYSPTLGRFLQTDPIGYDDQVNLYAYVANDPVNLKDVTGERITVVMHQVTVGPYQSGSYHMKIVVTPDDQKTFRNDERFSNRQNGVAFATIGAGPDTWKNVAGPLVSGVNRGTDVAKVKSGESLTLAELKPGKGDTENNLINRLFGVAGSYKNDLDYSLSPSAGGRDYNSNSFVQGVLGAVGANVTTPAGVSLPGADKPVPRTEFCNPGKDGCAR